MFAPGLNEKSISRESKIVTPELLVDVVTKQGWRHLTNIVGILKGNHDVWQHSHLNDIAKVYFKPTNLTTKFSFDSKWPFSVFDSASSVKKVAMLEMSRRQKRIKVVTSMLFLITTSIPRSY